MSRHVYLDHAATTDLLPEALEAYVETARRGGNPASLHARGRAARMALETGREQIAAGLGAEAVEVIMTSGGTESDNLALLGLYRSRRAADPRRRVIALSTVEHHAVSETAEWLAAHEGAQLVWLPVDTSGALDLETARELLTSHARELALVTAMWANNEVGTLQPVRELGEVCAELEVPLHVDAVQAFGSVPVAAHLPGIATLAVSAHKLGGPVGVGALYAPRTVSLAAFSHGGGQERDVRSGTVDAAGAASFGAAVEAVLREQHSEFLRIAALRDRVVAGIEAAVPDAVLRGPRPDTPEHEWQRPTRLPGNAHFTFPGCEGDSLLFLFDGAGICTSTGSACNAGVPRPSHVLLALGADDDAARGAQRFSLGHSTGPEDVAALLAVVADVHARASAAGLSGRVPVTGTR